MSLKTRKIMPKILTASTHPALAYYINPYASQISYVIRGRAPVHNVPVRVNSPVLSGPGLKAGTQIPFSRPSASQVIRPSASPVARPVAVPYGLLRNIGPFSIGTTGSGPITVTPGLVGGIGGHAVRTGGLPGFTVNIPVGRPKR